MSDPVVAASQALLQAVVAQAVTDVQYLLEVKSGKRKPVANHNATLDAPNWLVGGPLDHVCDLLCFDNASREIKQRLGL